MNLKQRSKGGTWYAHFNGPGGERLRLSTGTTDEAAAQLKALELMREHLVDALPESERGKYGNLETLGSLLRVAWEKRWRTQKAASEKRKLIGKIAREIGHWPVASITHERLETHLDSLTTGKRDPKPLSNASKNRYVSCIHTAMTIARAKNAQLVIPEFPSWPENNVKERYLSQSEERVVCDWFRRNTALVDESTIYLGHLFIVLLDTGMRCSEALEEMTPASLLPMPERPTKVHLRHGQTKSGKGRMVPLTERAKVAVAGMMASPLHGKWTSQNAGKKWKTVMAYCGIEGVTLHTLRHTTASRLVQAGVDLYQVMTWLGHSSMVITQRYAHFAPDTLTGALAALEKVSQADVPAVPVPYPEAEAHPVQNGTLFRGNLRVIK